MYAWVPHPLVCEGAGFDVSCVLAMRKPLRRYYGRADVHFITFSCYRRRPFLGTRRARDGFVKILDEVRADYQFRLFAFVVMPEHVHLLLSESERSNPSTVLQILKQRVSRALRARRHKIKLGQLSLPFASTLCEAPAFWQRRFYDFNVWSSKKFYEKLDYMHRNPVERRLVAHPKDWPWSSWSQCERGEPGLIRIDILGEERARHEKKKRQPPHP